MINLFETIVTEEAKKNVQNVLDSTFLNQGGYVDTFEETLAKEWNLSNPVTVNSCTSGLFLALKLAGIKENDRVLLPAQSFVATGLAVLMAGAKPEFVDVDSNGNMDCVSLKEKIIKYLPKAVIVVHWGGIPCDIKPIHEYCSNITNKISIIEDSAHAFGATYRDSIIGDCKYSDYCVFSFQSIKMLTTGDGGALCCKIPAKADMAKKLRWFGMSKKNITRGPTGNRIDDIGQLGFKMHMNDINGALGLGNLHGLKERLDIRFKRAMRYNVELFGINGLTLASMNYPCRPSYWLYTIKVENRDGFIKKMTENDIQVSTVDMRMDNYSVFGKKEYLYNQEKFEEQQISIPCTYSMTDEEQTKIIETIKGGW